MYCKECGEQIRKNDPYECLLCKKSMKKEGFVPMDQFNFKILKNLKFHCQNKGCKCEPLKYDQALKHLKACKSQEFFCPFNCQDPRTNQRTKLQGSQLE